MLRVMTKSAILNYIITVMTQLKWAWDFILYQSFFQTRQIGLLQCPDNGLEVTHHHSNNPDSDETEECAVCLCRIDEGDEIRELRCHYLFHRVCFDRWLGYGHGTCPLCRGNVMPPQFTAELIQELIVFNFSAARSRDDRDTWWLR
ncbi:hypothetical protein ACS0TY_009651 [Phlomoides rotata]